MSNYPPGMPGPRSFELEAQCVNPDCENESIHELPAVKDLGSCYVKNEDDLYCPDCGWEMETDDLERFPIVSAKDSYVLVDRRNEELLLSGTHYELEQARKGFRKT